MNFVQRAFKSIQRRKLKSVILFLIVFVLGNVIAGAVSILTSTHQVETKVKKELGSIATIEVNYDEYNKKVQDGEEVSFPEPVTVDQIKKVGKLKEVESYDYTLSDTYFSTNLKVVSTGESENEDGSASTIIVKGVNLPQVLDSIQGVIKITQGTTFTEKQIEDKENVVLISEAFAKLNKLTVGDTFTIDRTYAQINESGEQVYDGVDSVELKVIGLFTPESPTSNDLSDLQKETETVNMSFTQDTIYMPADFASDEMQTFYKTLIEKYPDQFNGVSVEDITASSENFQPIFILKSPNVAEEFKKNAQKELPDSLVVRTSLDSYQTIAQSMTSLASIANFAFIFAIVACILIVTLVIVLFLRDRKHELGIYLAIGEKKSKILGQILIEVFVVSIVAIVLSVFTGTFLAKGVSKQIIDSETSSQSSDYIVDSIALSNAVLPTTEEINDSFSISFSFPSIMLIIGIGLLTIIVATVIPVIYILRLNPRKILT